MIKHTEVSISRNRALELHTRLASVISDELGITDDGPTVEQAGLIYYTLVRLLVSVMYIHDPMGSATEENIAEIIRMLKDLSYKNRIALLALIQIQADGAVKQ